MIEVVRTDDFDTWLGKLRDRQARLRIVARIDRLAHALAEEWHADKDAEHDGE